MTFGPHVDLRMETIVVYSCGRTSVSSTSDQTAEAQTGAVRHVAEGNGDPSKVGFLDIKANIISRKIHTFKALSL